MKKKWFLFFSASVALFGHSSNNYNCATAAGAVLAPAQTQAQAKDYDDFETEAVVVDALSDHQQSNSRSAHGLSKDGRNGKQFFPYLPLFAEPYLVPILPQNENEVASAVPFSSGMDSSCVTNQGKGGKCESFEKCYPLLNLPESKFGNETTNYSNLQDELHQISVDRKCSAVVHAGNSKFSNVCCDDIPQQNKSPGKAQFLSVPIEDEEALNSTVTGKISKIVNTWATCGEKQFDLKIIGGQEGIPHEYPWMVSLWGKSGKHICGASLLDNNFVLTAAHCIAKYTSQDVGKIRLLVGDHDIHSTDDGHHEIRSVSRIIKHKRFSFQTFANDIALLKFDRPVPYTDRIRPICLPSGMKRTEDVQHLVVAGWGQTSFKGQSSSVLMKVMVPGISNESCGTVYDSISPVGITSDMLCAGGSGVDSCIGDSGGPLIQYVDNRYEQVGIVSFGRECGTYPGVYTKVHSYLKWITVNRNKY